MFNLKIKFFYFALISNVIFFQSCIFSHSNDSLASLYKYTSTAGYYRVVKYAIEKNNSPIKWTGTKAEYKKECKESEKFLKKIQHADIDFNWLLMNPDIQQFISTHSRVAPFMLPLLYKTLLKEEARKKFHQMLLESKENLFKRNQIIALETCIGTEDFENNQNHININNTLIEKIDMINYFSDN